MKLALVTLLAVSCAPPRCVTTCGVAIVGEPVDCAEYQRAEDALAAKLGPEACSTWDGTTAEAVSGKESVRNGKRVEGWSNCAMDSLAFHVGYPRFWRTAFAHELVHIAQGCDSPLPVDAHRDADHADWTRRGYGHALLEIQGAFQRADMGH